jgi:hypothetical protein
MAVVTNQNQLGSGWIEVSKIGRGFIGQSILVQVSQRQRQLSVLGAVAAHELIQHDIPGIYGYGHDGLPPTNIGGTGQTFEQLAGPISPNNSPYTITFVSGPHVRTFEVVFDDPPFGGATTFSDSNPTTLPLPDPGELTVFNYHIKIVDAIMESPTDSTRMWSEAAVTDR